jgi:hypothetical protein
LCEQNAAGSGCPGGEGTKCETNAQCSEKHECSNLTSTCESRAPCTSNRDCNSCEKCYSDAFDAVFRCSKTDPGRTEIGEEETITITKKKISCLSVDILERHGECSLMHSNHIYTDVLCAQRLCATAGHIVRHGKRMMRWEDLLAVTNSRVTREVKLVNNCSPHTWSEERSAYQVGGESFQFTAHTSEWILGRIVYLAIGRVMTLANSVMRPAAEN